MKNSLVKMSDLIDPSITAAEGQKEIDCKYLPALPSTGSDYLKLSFFQFWVVGFVSAEGSFLIKSNLDACFQIKQRTHVELFVAFQLLFKTTRAITYEKGIYAQFSVSSKKDIQTVIDFFSSAVNPPLLGNKLIQYNTWISTLKSSRRYGKLNFKIESAVAP